MTPHPDIPPGARGEAAGLPGVLPDELPSRLAAPAPGWSTSADVVVVGSGIAGLTVALRARGAGRVLVVTKDVLSAGSTQWAQGGIAAALGPGDTPEEHLADSLAAGVGLCNAEAVRVLVTEGPDAVRRLIRLGTRFDARADGSLALTREGGHRRRRIAHAGGDATGAEIQRALVDAVRADPGIEIIEHALVLDLLLDAAGAARGVTLHVMGEGQRDGVGAAHAPAVVLASGGIGQMYAATTNPLVSTGDGLALALRAGAVVRDLEFVQFHPTVLWLGRASAGQQPLVSEAVRGEGAFLVDDAGTRFMEGLHELADLAPRDVVAKAIVRRMREQGTDHVYLDARHFGEEKWRVRFPTILATCRSHGIDPVTGLIPVTPAAHYASGGVRTDLHGRTSVPRLYACGEVACTGVHGANRLASNSLLEGLVFAERIAADLVRGPGSTAPGAEPPGPRAVLAPDPRRPGLCEARVRARVQRVMTERVGVLRRADGMSQAARELAGCTAWRSEDACTETWEATNLLTVATVLTTAASRRAETRGSHWREDFPDTEESWRAHLDVTLNEGTPTVTYTQHAAPRLPIPAALAEELEAAGLDAMAVCGLVTAALAEDLDVVGDVTSAATIGAGEYSVADFVARADGVVAGLPVAEAVLHFLDAPSLRVERLVKEGDPVRLGDVVMTVRGRTRALLTAERTALNFLGRLSGVASLTARWVRAVDGTGARIRDTRKTTPGLRALEKYAVRCGGGVNHRMSLSDAAMIKDNHVVAAGGVAAAYRAVKAAYPDLEVEVEVDHLDQLPAVVEAGAEEILLDNFTVEALRRAVELVGGRARLEASGGLTLEQAREVAATGVDFLAVGALTHSAPVLDIALDLRADPVDPAREAGPPGAGVD